MLLPTRPASVRSVAVTGLAIGLVLVLAMVILIVRAVLFAPDDVVRAYLNALADRDADRAWSMLDHDEVGSRQTLLEQAALDNAGYQPPANITIESVTRDGGAATVEAALEVDGTHQLLSLSLNRGRPGVLQRWHIDDGLFALPLTGDPGGDLRLAGAPYARDSVEEIVGFPGGYTLSLADHPLLELPSTTAIAGGEPVTVSPTVHEGGAAAIQQAVQTHVDQCLASGELAPASCQFSAGYSVYAEDYVDVSWSLIEYPDLQYEVVEGGSVSVYGSGGVANVTATSTSIYSPDIDEDIELVVDGQAIVESGQVWFEPDNGF